MDTSHIRLLQELRDQWGSPLIVTSGSRCALWNASVGGAPNSQHLYGKATDLHLSGSDEILRLAIMAEKLGFGGIGRGSLHLLHIDTGPAGRRWTYQDL